MKSERVRDAEIIDQILSQAESLAVETIPWLITLLQKFHREKQKEMAEQYVQGLGVIGSVPREEL